RELFDLAREKAPSIIFIDEIDAIGAKRMDVGTSGEREVQRTFMQLISEMDGFDPLDNVKVLAATNRIDILDPALLRPGRFDRIIHIDYPSLEERVEIFKVHTKKVSMHPSVDVHKLAEETEGTTGAEIRSIVIEAGLSAIRRGSKVIEEKDFNHAIKAVMTNKTGKTNYAIFI
ncbi:MAG: AAA family ATPase, partial [Thermoprotei archaeon]